MLMPSIFGENLFDDWFDEFPFYDMDIEMNNTEKKLIHFMIWIKK